MPIEFPSILPPPSLEYSVNPRSSVQRTEMDSGRARQVRIATGAQDFVSARWDLSSAERSVFRAFMEHVIDAGATSFEMGVFDGGDFQTKVVTIVGGEISESYRAHKRWILTARIEVEDPPGMGEDFLCYVLDNPDSDNSASDMLDTFVENALSLHQFVHVDFPPLLTTDPQ